MAVVDQDVEVVLDGLVYLCVAGDSGAAVVQSAVVDPDVDVDQGVPVGPGVHPATPTFVNLDAPCDCGHWNQALTAVELQDVHLCMIMDTCDGCSWTYCEVGPSRGQMIL